MSNDDVLEKAKPFGALIASSSLVIAALYLAGFSYRWSYYYNFGLQNVVFDFNFESFLVTSIELIREPRNFLITAGSLVGALILVNAMIWGVLWLAHQKRIRILQRLVLAMTQVLGLENPLVSDALRALVVIYVISALSANVGYERFKADIINSPGNTLPVVTTLIDTDKAEELVLACGNGSSSSPNVIGDAKAIRIIRESNRTCNLDTTVWRLLHRDSKSVYLFASDSADKISGGRPLTIVLPNTDKVVLVME